MTCRWAKGKFPPRQPSEQRPRFAYDIFTEVEHVYGTPPRCLPFVITGREETVAIPTPSYPKRIPGLTGPNRSRQMTVMTANWSYHCVGFHM